MNKFLPVTLLGAMIALSPAAFAQEGPPGPPPQDQQLNGPPPQDNQGPPERRGNRPMPGMRMGGRNGRDNMDQGMPPQVQRMLGYLNIVERFSQMVKDADTARVAALMAATDTFRARGHDAVIDYLTKLLSKVEAGPNASPVLERAIHIQLGQEYQASGQSDKALEQFESIILNSNAPANK